MTLLNPPVNSKDHSQGSSKAVLVLVEYGDYQCPFCGHAYPIIKNIQQSFGSDLKFVYRNFPLTQMHPDAFNASLAAEAAGLQRRFLEMHDILFENQGQLHLPNLSIYAKAIGLDLVQFAKDIQENGLVAKVDQDFESGVRSGVNGTPTFFINGKRYNYDGSEQTFTEDLKNMLLSRV
jgi:protein-disulfide isomerase